MKSLSRKVFFAVFTLVILASTLSSAEIVIFSKVNFKGKSVTLAVNTSDLRVPTIDMNDKVRSFKIKNATSVAMFVKINYKGKCETFTGDVPNLLIKQVGIMGISSIKINATCPVKKAGAIFYKNKNFQGESKRVTANTGDLFFHPVKSVKLDGVSTVALFAKSNYQGNCDILAADQPNLKNTHLLDNLIGSVKLNGNCHYNGPYVILYEGKNYSGRPFRLTSGAPNLSNPYWGDMKNRVSSIKMFNMNSAALYKDEDYNGKCHTMTGNIPDLGSTTLKNNGLSSIRFNFQCQKTNSLKLRNNSVAVVRFDWKFEESWTWEKKRLAVGQEIILNLDEEKRLELVVYFVYPVPETNSNFQDIVEKCRYTIIMNSSHAVFAKGSLINPSCQHVIIPSP